MQDSMEKKINYLLNPSALDRSEQQTDITRVLPVGSNEHHG